MKHGGSAIETRIGLGKRVGIMSVAVAVAALFLVASPGDVVAEEDGILARANQLNAEGKELFARGELDGAASKFRAAIALSPQARYYFNLCFLLNARSELEAALGACAEVSDADGSDDRLRERTDQLIVSIEKKRARQGKTPIEPPPVEPDPLPDRKPDPKPPSVDPNAPPPITRPPGGRVAYPPPLGGGGGMPIVTRHAPPKRFHIGGVFGFSSSTLGETFDSGRGGIAAGGFFATPFTQRFGVQIEAIYIQRGGSDFFGEVADIELNYLSFPVLAKLHIPLGSVARVYAETGLALNFLLSSNGITEPNGLDFGFVIGGGLALHRQGGNAWTLNVRREQGLGEIGGGFSQANAATTLMFGYAF